MTAAQPRRRWFRFSLRSFLLLVLVGGSVLGWQMHVVHERTRLRQWLKFRDAYVVTLADQAGQKAGDPGIPHHGEIPWYRRLLGDEPVLLIDLREDVSEEAEDRVRRAFSESIVNQDFHGRPIDDREYAAIKARAAQERAYETAFRRIFESQSQPTNVDLSNLAPPAADRLSASAKVSLEAETITVEFAIECHRAAAQVREHLARLDKLTGAASTTDAQFVVDLKGLQAIAKAPPRRTPSAQLFSDRLLEYEIARFQAEAAEASDRELAREQFAEAIQAAGQMCDAATSALAEEVVTPDALVTAWERRRAARVAWAQFTSDPAANRAAWQEYADSVGQRLAVVERLYENGERGGEAEKYLLLKFCSLQAQAELARCDGDKVSLAAAAAACAAAGQELLEATQAAFDAEVVTVDLYVAAINRRAAAERRLAELGQGTAEIRNWQQRQADTLYALTARLNAFRLLSSSGYDFGKLHYVACHYILVRCRMAENSSR